MSLSGKVIALTFVAGLILSGISFRTHNGKLSLREAGASANDYDFTVEQNGLARKYRVYTPANYDPTVSWPGVMFLHGGGGNINTSEKDHMKYFADKLGFVLISPDGTGFFPNVFHTWNAGSWGDDSCCGWAADHDIDDVEFLSTVIDDVEGNFNVDPGRMYVTGMSNGGMMAYRLACELTDKISAVAAVAPLAVESGCSPSRPIPVMDVQGTDDPCVPYDGGVTNGCVGKTYYDMQSTAEKVDQWREIDGCSGNAVTVYKNGSAECADYTGCSKGGDVELCTIDGGGHAWPSGAQILPQSMVGPVSYDMSFDQMWNFFQRNTPKKGN